MASLGPPKPYLNDTRSALRDTTVIVSPSPIGTPLSPSAIPEPFPAGVNQSTGAACGRKQIMRYFKPQYRRSVGLNPPVEGGLR